MRMRKKKNGDKRLAACAHLLAEKPEQPIEDTWRDFGRAAEMHLEIGCGKGGFACGMAVKNPEACFYALERVSDVMVLAVEKAEREKESRKNDNLRFLLTGAAELPAYFAPGSLSVIYLNFSDPWPKKGHTRRRLTYRGFLRVYFQLLREGGELRLKTDNVGLFDFTLEELVALGLTPYFVTRDLHHTPEAKENVMTEYERNFSEQGIPICSLAVKKQGELASESESTTASVPADAEKESESHV